MVNNDATKNVYNAYVKQYVARFMDLNLYKDTFDQMMKALPLGGTVLDLGCGPGNVVRYLNSQRSDLHILGVDFAAGMIEMARRMNPGSDFRLMDIGDAAKIEGDFDAIIAAFCIPYLPFEGLQELFSQMGRLATRKAGLIYVSCMEGPREKSGFEVTSFTGRSELYINYYPRSEVESLITENGFFIENFFTREYHETDGSTTTDLIFIARYSRHQ